MSSLIFIKDPDAILDYGFDWSDWLATGETISSVVWTIPSGITKDSQDHSDTLASVWLRGGTVNTNYAIACKITTSRARTDERTMTVKVRQR